MKPVELAAPRNVTKARVRCEKRGDRRVVVKDFSSRPLLVRLVAGRPTLRREARAYSRLEGVRGIPHCHGLEGADRLVLEWIDARPVGRGESERLGESFFERAEQLLGEVHERGVAVADLHASNLLIGEDGDVHLIDLAQARIAADRDSPGPLVRTLMRLDEHALARIRARHLGEPEPRAGGAFGALYRGLRRVKRWLPSLR